MTISIKGFVARWLSDITYNKAHLSLKTRLSMVAKNAYGSDWATANKNYDHEISRRYSKANDSQLVLPPTAKRSKLSYLNVFHLPFFIFGSLKQLVCHPFDLSERNDEAELVSNGQSKKPLGARFESNKSTKRWKGVVSAMFSVPEAISYFVLSKTFGGIVDKLIDVATCYSDKPAIAVQSFNSHTGTPEVLSRVPSQNNISRQGSRVRASVSAPTSPRKGSDEKEPQSSNKPKNLSIDVQRTSSSSIKGKMTRASKSATPSPRKSPRKGEDIQLTPVNTFMGNNLLSPSMAESGNVELLQLSNSWIDGQLTVSPSHKKALSNVTEELINSTSKACKMRSDDSSFVSIDIKPPRLPTLFQSASTDDSEDASIPGTISFSQVPISPIR